MNKKTEYINITYYDTKTNSHKTFEIKTLPVISFAWNKDKQELFINLHCLINNPDFIDKKVLNNVIIEMTDDNTLDYAGGVVSLGYYVCRIEIGNAKINIKENQLVFSTRYLDGFRFRISRPARRFEFPELNEKSSYIITGFGFIPKKEESCMVSLLFKPDHSNFWQIIKSDLKSNKIVYYKLNPMSLFYPIEVVNIPIKLNENIKTKHNELVEQIATEDLNEYN